MFNKLFNNLFGKKTVVVALDKNVKLTVIPVCGGVNATIEEVGDIFIRRESAFFATCEELTKSLRLNNDAIVKKLAKAF